MPSTQEAWKEPTPGPRLGPDRGCFPGNGGEMGRSRLTSRLQPNSVSTRRRGKLHSLPVPQGSRLSRPWWLSLPPSTPRGICPCLVAFKRMDGDARGQGAEPRPHGPGVGAQGQRRGGVSPVQPRLPFRPGLRRFSFLL